MRCLALAQACLAEGGQAHFLMSREGSSLAQRILDEGAQVSYLSTQGGSEVDAQAAIALANSWQADWVVVDGYHFGDEYQKWLKNAGLKVLAIDDYGHASHCWADVVLNQNITADEALYSSREPYTRLLLGTRYVLLRKEFWPWRDWQRQILPVATKVLVTLGGSDPDNVTLSIMQALQKAQVEGLEAVVVIGGSNPHYKQLEQAINGTETSITLKQNVSNMPELMAWADFAITAGGSTCWETAFMELPSLVMVTAENQRKIVQRLASLNQIISIGTGTNLALEVDLLTSSLENLSKDFLARQSIRALSRPLVDGLGSFKVIKSLENEDIILRSVDMQDSQILWDWANEKGVRESSFSPEKIEWNRHIEWLKEKIGDKKCSIYIALLSKSKVPIGQIRFDVVEDKNAIVDISVDSKFRGLGYGEKILRKGIDNAFKLPTIETLIAFVKTSNYPSMKIFECSGFKATGKKTIKGHDSFCYRLNRG